MKSQSLFKNRETEKNWQRAFVKKWSKELQQRVWEEMSLLFSFTNEWLKLKEVFGTDLEVLKGQRKGQYSIRVNDQWRLCLIEPRVKFLT